LFPNESAIDDIAAFWLKVKTTKQLCAVLGDVNAHGPVVELLVRA
jgi:hypothetical protein